MFEKTDTHLKTILITDDEPINLKILQGILSKKHTTITAADGKTCIEKAKATQPDLILLDIRMPFMDGIDVCRILKKKSRTKNIPVIFVTADTDSSTLQKAFESGGTDYVRKPVNLIELMADRKSVV